MSKRESLPPEDSIPLRIIVYLMTLTCILASCIFVKTAWPVAVLGFTLCTIGSLVAYQYRHENQKWMQIIVVVGVLAVGANALAEFMNPMNGPADFWGPVVHFIAGTFALHTFDLKSRSDINLSAMLGALILCCLSPVARSLAFGGAVLTYISLGTVMLYYDCMSRTLTNWLDRPMKPAPIVPSFVTDKRRSPSGSAQLTLALLPIITLISFLVVPRSDDTMDIITSSLKNMNLASLMRLLPDFSNHDAAHQPTRNTYNAPLHNLGVKRLNDAEKKAAQLAAQEQQANKPPVTPPSGKGKDPAAKASAAESEKEKEKEKEKSKATAKPAEKQAKDEKVGEQGSDKGSGKKAGKESKAQKDQKLADAIAKVGGGNGGKNGAGKGSGKGSGEGTGKGAGKGAGKGTNGTNGTNGTGGTGGGGEGGSLANKLIDMDGAQETKSKEMLFKVSSTRLFYERRAVFDNFDGRFWMRSKDFLTAKNMDIKPITGKPETTVEPQAAVTPGQPALSEEAQAEKELEEERLRSLDGELSGFGAATAVHYVFFKPEKPNFDVKKANAFIVPKVLPTVELTQGYEVLSDLDNVVPVCWIPQMVGIGGKTLTVDDYGMVQSSEVLKKGTTFKVVSQLPLYDTARMRNEPVLTMQQEEKIRKQLSNYLQLPENLSPEVVNFANQSAGQTGNWFSTADKICKILRSHAKFEANKPTDFEAAEDRISQFLFERKLGNSKDFAASFVVLCRSVGLPARLVSGYGIGKTNKISGMREISSSDAHVWSEVFIPDYGWVPFDSVPDGILPAQAREEGYSFSALEKMVEAQTGLDLSDDGLSPRRIMGWIAIIISSLILLAGIIYGIIVLIKHLRQEAAMKRWRGPEWKLYLAIIKDLKKIKIERMEHETSTQFVHRVADIIKDRIKQGMNADRGLPDALSDFFTVYDAVHFGNKDLMPDLKEKASEVHKLVKSKGK